ncbi:hypothetical protein R6Z07M_013045 [Ovis aries]
MPPPPSPTPSLARRPQLGEFEVFCGSGVRSAVAERETGGLESGLPVPGESDKEAPRPHRLQRHHTQTHSAREAHISLELRLRELASRLRPASRPGPDRRSRRGRGACPGELELGGLGGGGWPPPQAERGSRVRSVWPAAWWGARREGPRLRSRVAEDGGLPGKHGDQQPAHRGCRELLRGIRAATGPAGPSAAGIVLNKRKYRSQHIIPLEEVTLETLPETLQAKNRWMIKTAKKSFVVSAASATERQEWISHIEECVRRQLLATGLQPSTEHAAPWIPDKATDICMRCTQTRFSALTRRHHCRKCGFVVCAECSRERFLLPRLSPKPLRVCSLCFRELAAQKRKEDVEEQGLGSPGPSAYLAGAVCGASSGDDDDSDEDREGSGDGDWPSHVEFYASGVSWSSFHS